MELKHGKSSFAMQLCKLLIVPYGIETRIQTFAPQCILHLLIVPYGIETRLVGIIYKLSFELLIVPYGIETT